MNARRTFVLAALVVAGATAAVALVALVVRWGPEEAAHAARIGPAAPDPCGSPVIRPNGRPWLCTFVDEFDGDTLDPDRWQPLTTLASGARQHECRIDDPTNIAVRNGVLRLTAERLPRPTYCETPDGVYLTRLAAGGVTTSRRFAQAYGRVEIRAALPAYDGPGFHSALWLYPQAPAYGEWPASGEIDLAEYRTGLPGRAVPTLHFLAERRHRVVTSWRCEVSSPEEFHTYVLVWTPDGMRFEYDGRVCLVAATGKPFDQPFFLVLNQSHGIRQNARTASTPASVAMKVDWVKVWR